MRVMVRRNRRFPSALPARSRPEHHRDQRRAVAVILVAIRQIFDPSAIGTLFLSHL